MAIDSTSFTNTPQASDDEWFYEEDELIGLLNTAGTGLSYITLDVMSDDLGGKAKKLFSISDADGNELDASTLLQADGLVSGVSEWKDTTEGNSIRINDGKIDFGISAGKIQSLADGEAYQDTFIYAICLANGTLSWATVTVNIVGSNDAATITANSDYEVKEAGGVANGMPGDASASGKLTVHDVDAGQNVFQAVAPASLVGTYGSFTFDKTSGEWTYTLDQSKADQLTEGQKVTDILTVTSFDGTATETITVNITGTNDAPLLSFAADADVGAVQEDTTLTVSGQFTSSDIDHGAGATWSIDGTATGSYGSIAVDDTGKWTYTLANGNDGVAGAVQSLAAGEHHDETFTVKVSDGLGGEATQQVTITVTGTNDAPVAQAASFTVAEDAAVISGNVVATDLDANAVLVYALDAEAPAGLTFNADGSYSFDAGNAAYQNLGVGQQAVLIVGYTVTDDQLATAQAELTITVTGTNDGPVAVADTSTATEDATIITGTVATNDSDVDDGALLSYSLNAPVAGLAISADGSYSFDPSNAAYQHLAAGASTNVVANYTVTDEHGAASTSTLTITVTGTNDVPVIGGVSTGAVIEDVSTPDLSTSGALSIVDVDTGESSFVAQAGTAGSNGHGSFTLAADGSWTYTASNSQTAIQQLGAGQSITDSFTAVSSDGTASQLVTVTINGTNDVPTLGGVSSGDVTEDASAPNLSTSGALTIADVDAGQSTFAAQAGSAGTHGIFTLDAAGNWTYTADNSQTAIQQLGAGLSITDSFTAVSSDGTNSQLVTVTINGTNDAAVITGSSTASLTETNAAQNTSGTLVATDVDSSDAFVEQTGVAGSNGFGTFSIGAAGVWTYAMNGAHNEFVGGTDYTDSITVATADGTTQVLTVTIAGTNDAAVITGSSTASLTETNATQNTGGTLVATDVDSSNAFVEQTGVAGSNGFGTFSIGAAGVWTYAMNGAHNEFVGGTDYTDSITVATADGTTQVLTVTMHGTNDVPVIGGVSIGAVTEDATTPNLSASGALTIADVDTGESSFVAQAGTAGTHGVFTLDAAGAWTYTADNSQSAIQQLGAGQSITDSFTAFSSDGTASQVVTVTINGTNDVATDIGLSSNSILENADGAVIGALTTTDVDNGDTHTYTVSDDRFEVVDGNLKLKEGVSLDFENKPAVTITVTTTDNHSASFDKEFTINVTDVNEAPTVALPYTGTGDPNDFDGLVGVASGSFTLVNGTDEGDTITPGPAGSDTSKNDKDIINGFAGNDTINAGDATDQVYGGDGDDVINGGDQVDSLYGQAGSDTIHGDAFGDIIYGGSGGDILYGDIADDIIYGGSGSDIIYGGDGNDTIIGGYGADTLSGGGGNDTFMFLDVLDTGDVITDFLPGTDTLDFSAIAGITGIAEAPSSTVTANSINYFQQGNDMIVWADTDGITSTVEFQVTLTGVTATSSDFVL